MKEKNMILKKIVVGCMGVNCYIVGDANTKEVFIIDPGGDYQTIKNLVEKNNYKAVSIINTHGHIDHIGANKYLDLPVWIHKLDAGFLEDAGKNLLSLIGFGVRSPAASRLLDEGDILKAGNVSLEVVHTPGHTPGSICLKSNSIIFTGDTLFFSGVGRTDFPYGSEDDLYSSLRKKVLVLDDDVIVYPGHGPSTTIGKEKRKNYI